MPVNYTDNFGSTYINVNECRSYNQPLTTALVGLSSQVCSEVIIYNKSGQEVSIYDSNHAGASNGLVLDDNDVVTIRGVTNSEQVSAKTTSGTGLLYYRTQYYSITMSR
jgi:hypothetical protein